MSDPKTTSCNRVLSPPVSLPFQVDSSEAIEKIKKKIKRINSSLGCAAFTIFKKSIDARKKDDIRFVYTILITTDEYISVDKEALENEGFRICPKNEIIYTVGDGRLCGRPIIVGSGPAGMFCSLILAEQGYRPILIERGERIDNRVRTVNSYFNGSSLNTESNVMFGAGGAGTFSDGKLVTRINDPLCGYVIARLSDMGAPDEIVYKAKPHIGTDLLRGVVDGVLSRVIECGGEVIYNCRLDSFEEAFDNTVIAHTTLGDIKGGCIVLAIGHSARDTYKYLNNNAFSLKAKPFSVGVRVEHLREDIEIALYGKYAGDARLGAAEYSLSDTKSGRGVYTFCMCPGGEVIAASSDPGGVVVNGMSNHARAGVNSNSAVAVSVLPTDYDPTPMGAIAFQRELESRAFLLGGSDYSAPIELMGDFLSGKKKNLSEPSIIKPSYTRGNTRISDISGIFPHAINEELKRGFASFGRKLVGFDSPYAVLTAVESRTSAPIRILRDENFRAIDHSLVFPCGEGAGYAGGITSAAVDGVRTALAIIKDFKPY